MITSEGFERFTLVRAAPPELVDPLVERVRESLTEHDITGVNLETWPTYELPLVSVVRTPDECEAVERKIITLDELKLPATMPVHPKKLTVVTRRVNRDARLDLLLGDGKQSPVREEIRKLEGAMRLPGLERTVPLYIGLAHFMVEGAKMPHAHELEVALGAIKGLKRSVWELGPIHRGES